MNTAAAFDEPGAIDSVCQFSHDSALGYPTIRAFCRRNPTPSPEDARAGLISGGIPIVPGGPLASSAVAADLWMYQFVVDTGQRPLKTPAVFPAGVADETASCLMRFDLNPDGSTANACVACAATAMQAEYEQSARAALASWLYPAATPEEAPESRVGLIEGLKFERTRTDGARINAPALPEMACGASTVDGAAVETMTVEGRPSAELLLRVPPAYPPQALRQSNEATCSVSFDLEPDGKPTNICAACAATKGSEEGFERSIIAMMADWRYAPLAEEDVEIRTGLSQTITFQLADSNALLSLRAPPLPVCERN
jgi:TonB family protein